MMIFLNKQLLFIFDNIEKRAKKTFGFVAMISVFIMYYLILNLTNGLKVD